MLWFYITFRIILSSNISFSEIYFPLLGSFPFRLSRSCRINSGFLHWTPMRIDYDYLFPFISTSYLRLPGTKEQTADHRKRGHREKTEGKGIGWSVAHCHPPLLILRLRGNVAITVSILDDGTKRDVTRRGRRTTAVDEDDRQRRFDWTSD